MIFIVIEEFYCFRGNLKIKDLFNKIVIYRYYFDYRLRIGSVCHKFVNLCKVRSNVIRILKINVERAFCALLDPRSGGPMLTVNSIWGVVVPPPLTEKKFVKKNGKCNQYEFYKCYQNLLRQVLKQFSKLY